MKNRKYASIDPGKWACSVAVWGEDGKLETAAYIKSKLKQEPGVERPEIWRHTAKAVANYLLIEHSQVLWGLVLEIPQVYEAYQDKDKNDLIDLAGVLGGISTALVGVSEVEWAPLPREWKGQLRKEHTRDRVDRRLSDDEKARITWPSAASLRHNVYDAIHMGIVFLEREGLRALVK